MKNKIDIYFIAFSVFFIGLFFLVFYKNEGQAEYQYLFIAAAGILRGFKEFFVSGLFYSLFVLIAIGVIVSVYF